MKRKQKQKNANKQVNKKKYSIKKENTKTKIIFLAIIATLLKLSLTTLYHSTDFDVHQNWLSLTHNLPLNEWYKYEGSYWTLDYPPFFAYFEFLLSHFYSLFVKILLEISSLLQRISLQSNIFQMNYFIFDNLIEKIQNELLQSNDNFNINNNEMKIEVKDYSIKSIIMHRLSIIIVDFLLFYSIFLLVNSIYKNNIYIIIYIIIYVIIYFYLY